MRYQPSFRGGGCPCGYVCVCEVWMVLCVWTWIRDGRDTEERKAPCWHDPGNRVTSFFLSFFPSLPLSLSPSPRCPRLAVGPSPAVLPPPPRSWSWDAGVPGGAGLGGCCARRRLLAGGQRSAGEQEPLHTLLLSFERKRARREERNGKEPTSSRSLLRRPYL